MILDLHERVKVAYKKLKQMVHYEKHPLTLRRRLAEFECKGDFEERLRTVTKVAEAQTPHQTSQFIDWLADIRFDVVPKGITPPDRIDEEHGSFLTNVTSAPVYKVSKVNYMFDGPVELHLLSILWLMIEGPQYDGALSSHCLGSRLHQFVGNDEDHSAYLFKKYHELYAKWRDSGIQKARELLSKEGQSVCLVGLDVQEYYYRIELDWEKLRAQIKRPKTRGALEKFFISRQRLGAKLFRCVEAICRSYQEKLNPMLAVTHGVEGATCLPIGLCASPVIANWYLTEFDDAILEKVRPAYYGRYVDDILMVVPMSRPPEDADPINSLMEQIFVRTGILKREAKESRFELCSRPGLFLQKKKCKLQFFDAGHSTAGLEKFQKQIEENASAFALLPVDGDDSPVAQVAYDLLYDGSVNKFRSVKEVAENRWELASHLAKQTQLHLMTEGPLDSNLKDELFRFFKGRNAIDYWDMWERVIGFLIVASTAKIAERFKEAMRREIGKVKYSARDSKSPCIVNDVSVRLRETLERHLDLCMELNMAITTSGNGGDSAVRFWRESNLVRHYLVAVPLLNYTDYQGNLAAPVGAKGLVIDEKKADNTPRFVHFDECLGFVNSGCARLSKEDRVTRANEIYKLFHGSEFMGVSSELIDEGDPK